MKSPSRFACEALGLKPAGTPWRGETSLTCTLEGTEIAPGDWMDGWIPGQNFTDDTDLAARSGVISGWVSVFMRKPVMIKTQRCVFTTEGCYSLATDASRAWLLLTPPKPPWLAVIGDSTLQHLVWRTPLTLDNDLMRIRLGKEAVLTIRRPFLLEALNRIQDERARNPEFRHGFVFLDREAKDAMHGIVRRDTPEELSKFFKTLTNGEIWALAILAKANTPVPTMPESVSIAVK